MRTDLLNYALKCAREAEDTLNAHRDTFSQTDKAERLSLDALSDLLTDIRCALHDGLGLPR